MTIYFRHRSHTRWDFTSNPVIPRILNGTFMRTFIRRSCVPQPFGNSLSDTNSWLLHNGILHPRARPRDCVGSLRFILRKVPDSHFRIVGVGTDAAVEKS